MRTIDRETTIITSKEAAECYGCSVTRLHQLILDGRLKPLIHTSNVVIFDQKDVESLRDEMELIREARNYHPAKNSTIRARKSL